MNRQRAEEAYYRALLSPDELVAYACCGSIEPLRLPPVQLAKLVTLLGEARTEQAGTGAGWHVDRMAYGQQDRKTA